MSKRTISPISFIGIADHIKAEGQPFPIGPVDIFHLSQHKIHIIYPAITTNNQWVFLIHSKSVDEKLINNLSLRVVDEEGREYANINLSTVSGEPVEKAIEHEHKPDNAVPVFIGAASLLFYVKIDALVNQPGRYIIQANVNGKIIEIGEAYFHYQPTPPLTRDQIKAIESDPTSAKVISIECGCKHCPTKIHVYTALERQTNFEANGFTWQHDVDDSFKCDCGKTSFSLRYVRESLHGMLLKGFSSLTIGLSYERMYGHAQVTKIIQEYNKLLKTDKDEAPFQEFIEKHPILLARFHAKRLFIKPNILGKFETDFAILNSRNELLLIELEKPSLKLFKKDGHPTAGLIHAYSQVQDWLYEYAKHPSAVIEGLGLKHEPIMAVKGVVIAGKLSSDILEPLKRHNSKPPYPEIEFSTLDDLSESLLEISRRLA
jgi:hypothetical protein